MKRSQLYEIFARGDRPLIDFLDYSVRSIQSDLLFMFLIRDYQGIPSAAKAVALYDMFCAPQAPGRISSRTLLPPFDSRLAKAVTPLTGSGLLPPKYLFDFLYTDLAKNSPSLKRIRRYKTDRSPVENLPDGKMTAPQRHFVEKIWEPIIRPRLVTAGFWRVAAIA
jgi:hypothetical protein